MKRIFSILFMILFFSTLVNAQSITNTTTTTSSPVVTTLKSAYNFLISINPLLLIILGIILLLVSKLSKFVGIILIIIALIHLFLILIH